MSTYLCIRKTTYDAQPYARKAMLGVVMERIALRGSSVYNDGTHDYYVFGHAFIPEDIARVGTLTEYITFTQTTLDEAWHKYEAGDSPILSDDRISLRRDVIWTYLRTVDTGGGVDMQDRVVRQAAPDTTPFVDRTDLDVVLSENYSGSVVQMLLQSPIDEGWTEV